MNVNSLTSPCASFEDFVVGSRTGHARVATIGDGESKVVTQRVMNTAQVPCDEEMVWPSSIGNGRVVHRPVTASMTVGLAGKHTGDDAVEEIGVSAQRFHRAINIRLGALTSPLPASLS
jgi:acyl dehydratase